MAAFVAFASLLGLFVLATVLRPLWRDARAVALGVACVSVLSDVEGRTALDWGVYGAPETFLVDGRGIVRWKHVGPLDQTIIDGELLPLLTRIEGEQ